MAKKNKPAQDDLLAELNGSGVKLENPDGPIPEAPKGDPLEVVDAPLSTPAKVVDAKYSTAAGGKGFRVTVRGQFIGRAKDSDTKVRKSYQHDFNLPSLDAALSVIVGKLLDPALRKKYGDEYIRFHTHEIVEAVPLSPLTHESNNLQYMSREKLNAYVEEHNIPVDIEAYPDIVHLRAAVVDYTLNPKGFEEREEERQKARREAAELAAMNPGLDVPVA